MSSSDDLDLGYRPAEFPKAAALVVGAGRGAGISGARPPDIEKEARELGRVLGVRGGYSPSSVRVLVEEEASLEVLRGGLSWLVATAHAADSVVLFCFAGAAIKLTQAGRSGVYLLPFDADPSDVPGTALSIEELAAVLDRTKRGRALIYLDLFYPTEFIINTTALATIRGHLAEADVAPLSAGGRRVVIVAPDTSSPAERADEGRESLTILLSQAIEGAAFASHRNGLLHTDDLIYFLRGEAATLKAVPPLVAPASGTPDFPISLHRRVVHFATPLKERLFSHFPTFSGEDSDIFREDSDILFGDWKTLGPPPPSGGKSMDSVLRSVGHSLPAATGTLYPKVSSVPEDFVEPDQEVVFTLELEAVAPTGVATAISFGFPAGAASTLLHASVSSTSFTPPEGETWSATFTVTRDLEATPARWTFRARALSELLSSYSLTVTFLAAGFVVGAVVVTLPRRQTNGLPSGLLASGEPMAMPKEPGAARLVMKISHEPPSYKIRLYVDGEQVGEAVPWTISTDEYFDQLEAASSVDELHAVGAGLWADLPSSVTAILERPDLAGVPMLIVSDTPIAPFEVLRLRPSDVDGPLLGFDRPVLRWIDDASMPRDRERVVGQVACIRPEYQPPDELPSAAKEEEELRSRAPSLRRVARINELDELLNEAGVRLIHFAGHADGNPAKLELENGSVLPARFVPSKPLLREGNPFMFLNGCRAGRARDATPSTQANIIKLLLKFRCSGAIAPVIPIHSAAALSAATTFYTALVQGKSVGDAMLEVRRLAGAPGTEPGHIASLMSYLVFAAPGFCLRFEAG